MFTDKMLMGMLMPLLMERIFGMLVGTVDSVMVSSVGEAAISAVALVNSIVQVALTIFAALNAGGGIVISQFVGARRMDMAKRAAGQAAMLAVAISGLVGLVCVVFSRQILATCFGAVEEQVMEDAITYLTYSAASFPLIALRGACGTIYRCAGNTKASFKVTILANIVNVVGNYICIKVLHMGVEGVAIPTVLCRLVGVVAIMLMLRKDQLELKPDMESLKHIEPGIMGKVFRLSMPTAIENSIFEIGRVLTLGMIAGFGTYQIAANSTAGALLIYANMMNDCTGTLALTVIGQCVGAKDEVQLRYYNRKMMSWIYTIGGGIAFLMILFRYQLVGLYENLSPETIELAADLMLIHLGGMIFLFPTSFYLGNPLRAANDTVYTMAVGVTSMLLLRLVLARILCVNFGMGAIGVWLAMVCDWVVRSLFFASRFYKGGWKKKCGMADMQAEKENRHDGTKATNVLQ